MARRAIIVLSGQLQRASAMALSIHSSPEEGPLKHELIQMDETRP